MALIDSNWCVPVIIRANYNVYTIDVINDRRHKKLKTENSLTKIHVDSQKNSDTIIVYSCKEEISVTQTSSLFIKLFLGGRLVFWKFWKESWPLKNKED